jgi:CheY-like chemotaxis protein
MSQVVFCENQYKKHILLVDDDEADREIFRRVFELEDRDMELAFAQSGVDAIRILKEIDNGDPLRRARPPHLILLDIDMPNMDGFETLAAIRSIGISQLAPVIVYSTSSCHEDVAKSYKLGANCFIQKPSSLNGCARVLKQIESYWFSTVLLPAG